MKKGTRIWFGATMLTLCTAACTPVLPPADVGGVANGYISLVLELARHDPSLVDHWLTAPPTPTGARQPVPALRPAIDRLAADAERAVRASTGPDLARARHLLGQIRALSLAARRLLGESMPFDAEARLGLGVEPARADQFQVDRAREALERELPGPEPLAQRVAAFRQSFVVSEQHREAVLQLAFDGCRVAVGNRLALPDDEGIELRFVPGLPWDAHARYLGSHRTLVEVNASRPMDLTRALRLACHEGYAGHHAQYIWLDDEVIGRRQWTEFALVAGFGPDLLASEGTAEAGADLAMPPARRLAVYRDHLAPAAGLPLADLDRLGRIEEQLAVIESVIGDIARDYLDNRINTAGAVERLSNEALVAAAEPFVAFIEHRRTRLLAYAEGRRLALSQAGGSGLAALPQLLVTGLGQP